MKKILLALILTCAGVKAQSGSLSVVSSNTFKAFTNSFSDQRLTKPTNGITSGVLLGVNSGVTAYEYKTLVAGTGVSITPSSTNITIAATSAANVTTAGAASVGSVATYTSNTAITPSSMVISGTNAAVSGALTANSIASTVNVAGATLSVGAASPVASSIASFTSTTGGILPPRMTKAQRDAIAKVDGLILYQTDNTQGLKVVVSNAWYSVMILADP